MRCRKVLPRDRGVCLFIDERGRKRALPCAGERRQLVEAILACSGQHKALGALRIGGLDVEIAKREFRRPSLSKLKACPGLTHPCGSSNAGISRRLLRPSQCVSEPSRFESAGRAVKQCFSNNAIGITGIPDAEVAQARSERLGRVPVLVCALLAPWWLGERTMRWRRWYTGIVLAVIGGAIIALAWAIPAGLRGGEYKGVRSDGDLASLNIIRASDVGIEREKRQPRCGIVQAQAGQRLAKPCLLVWTELGCLVKERARQRCVRFQDRPAGGEGKIMTAGVERENRRV